MQRDTTSTTLLVRVDRRWRSTTVPPSTPMDLDMAEVRELLGTPAAGRSDRPDPPTDAGHLSPRLRAPWLMIGLIDGSSVHVEAPSGDAVELDIDDLELMDAADRGTSVEQLRSQWTDERTDRLLRHRLLVPDTSVPTDTDDTPTEDDRPVPVDDSPTSAPSSGGRLAALLARLRLGRAGSQAHARREPSAGSGGSGSSPELVEHGSPQPGSDEPAPTRDDRIPVYSIWQDDVGPMLSLGLLLAAARHHDEGALNTVFDLRPMETADSFLADLATRRGPAVLLCSDYVWSVDHNLEAARAGVALNPELIVVHGGPSAPKYEADAVEFMDRNRGVAHVLVRGEGEQAICEVLAAIAAELPELDGRHLATVDGLVFRDGSGDVRRTKDRERISDLDTIPSPYLTGEFDHLEPQQFLFRTLFLETNRGCPYGCTFCDWGSATMARVRKFSVERVLAECEWAQQRGFEALFVCDANFGILPQDEEISVGLVDLRQRTGFPAGIGMTLAKNSTKRVMKVVDVLLDGGIPLNSCISLQTVDPAALEASDRQNIDLDVYLDLAATLRRRGYGLQGDVVLGLPGQTYEAYRNDLQFMFDHEIMARTWPARVLVNSPMNDADYKRRWGIRADGRGFLLSTDALSCDELERALRLRMIDEVADRYAVLRHVQRLLQWDYGIRAMDFDEHLLQTTADRPGAYPLITWTFGHFDLYPTVAVGRRAFYDEVRRYLSAEYGIDGGSDVQTVLDVQIALLPSPGREFPLTVDLPHDYTAYYLSATRSLYETGRSGSPEKPLVEYPPAQFTVQGDPLGICENGIFLSEDGAKVFGKARERMIETDFHVGSTSANELHSPLIRILPALGGFGPHVMGERLSELDLDRVELDALLSGRIPDESIPSPVSIQGTTA
jgi:hypothetical protein